MSLVACSRGSFDGTITVTPEEAPMESAASADIAAQVIELPDLPGSSETRPTPTPRVPGYFASPLLLSVDAPGGSAASGGWLEVASAQEPRSLPSLFLDFGALFR